MIRQAYDESFSLEFTEIRGKERKNTEIYYGRPRAEKLKQKFETKIISGRGAQNLQKIILKKLSILYYGVGRGPRN